MKHFRNSVSLKHKYKIIKLSAAGVKQSAIAKKFRIAKSTVSLILKSKETLLLIDEQTVNKNAKKNRKVKHTDVEKSVLYFVTNARNANIPLSGSVVQAKVKLEVNVHLEVIGMN